MTPLRGTCQVCRRDRQLTKAGNVWFHFAPEMLRLPDDWTCRGSGRAPASIVETPADQVVEARSYARGVADTYAKGRVVRYWYESHLPDGTLWCGTSDPREVVERSAGHDCTFRVTVTREIDQTQPWQPPTEENP